MRPLAEIRPRDYLPALGGDAAQYSEVFLQELESTSVHLEDSRIEDIATLSEVGMGLRYLLRKGRSIETLQASANSLDPAEALRLKKGLLADGLASAPALKSSTHSHPVTTDPRGLSIDRKVSLLEDLDRHVRGHFPHIRQVSISYAERGKVCALLNSEGTVRREDWLSVTMMINVIAEKEGNLQTGISIIGGLKGFELLDDFPPFQAAAQAAQRAILKLDAPKAKAGDMPVVLAATAGGTFVHEAIGHSLEADHVQEGASPAYKGKVGTQVAHEGLSIIDDPTLPFCRGSFDYDDEGIKARPCAVVKNGVLQDYLYDRVTAMREEKTSNGHGRRESFHCRPIPRMSNFYIAPGKDDPKAILKGLKKGIFVTRMGGGQVNTATGEFVFEIDEGYWVEDGVIRHMIRDANLLGVGPEILKSIDRIGWDIGWGIGLCGKDGQSVPVSDGQPTLRIPDILIGGTHE